MKIIIMTDMEGVAGVESARDYIIRFDSRYYEYGCELATLEASAAAEGAFEAGATDVLVVDGHGHGAMKRGLLHPRARLLSGRSFPPDFCWGLDGSFAAAMSIGQHAKANTDGGHLAHTGSFGCEEQIINGVSMGEFGCWLLMAGAFHVPVVMVSGDEAFCEEARALVPNIETAAVKSGIKRGSATGLTAAENEVFNEAAIHLSPDEARRVIRERAYRGVKRIPEIVPYRMEPPYTMKVGVRPLRSGGKPVFATVKSTDVLEIVVVQRAKAFGKCSLAMAKREAGKAEAPGKAAKKRPGAGSARTRSARPARKKVAQKSAQANRKKRRKR